MKKTYFRFGTKIILVSCMSIVFLAFFISFFSFNNYQKRMVEKTSNSIMQAFIQTNEMMDYNIRSYENLLASVADNQTIQEILSTDFDSQYDWLISEMDLNRETLGICKNHPQNPKIQYYFLHPHEITISTSYVSLPKMLPDDFVDTTMASNGFGYVWSNVYKDKTQYSINYYIVVSKLYINRVLKTKDAIAYISIKTKNLFESIAKLDYTGGNIFVLSASNEILYHQTNENIGSPYTNESLLQKISEKTNGFFVDNIDGEKYLIVYNRENKNSWTLVGLLPYDNVMSEISITKTLVFGITIIVTLLAFLFVYFYLRNNMNKITLLSSAMEQAGNGALDVQVHLKGHGEINQMADVFTSMLTKINHYIAELEKSHQREHELELRVLQKQINPHLLYNTLSIINSYAEEIDAYEISDAVLSLIAYYKLTLSEGMAFITVKDELSHVKAYTQIMKMRFGDYLTIDTAIDPEVYPYSCPKLILQPFIENSIYHGFAQNDHYEGSILLEAFRKGEDIVFQITDNGCGMNRETIQKIMTEPGCNYAVKNVDARIKLYYGKDYGIHILSRPAHGCRIVITIPTRSPITK